MKQITHVVILAASLTLIGGYFFTQKVPFIVPDVNAQTSPTPLPELWFTGTDPIPEEIKYLMLFEEIRDLVVLDRKNRAVSKTTQFKASFCTNQLGLTPAQVTSVESVIENTLTQIDVLDAHADQIIAWYRAQNPNGKIEVSSKLLPIPEQLITLHNQKNQIVLSGKEQIKTSLGASQFSSFEAAVNKNATQILMPAHLPPWSPRTAPSPLN
jgi:hypothetical protein